MGVEVDKEVNEGLVGERIILEMRGEVGLIEKVEFEKIKLTSMNETIESGVER